MGKPEVVMVSFLVIIIPPVLASTSGYGRCHRGNFESKTSRSIRSTSFFFGRRDSAIRAFSNGSVRSHEFQRWNGETFKRE